MPKLYIRPYTPSSIGSVLNNPTILSQNRLTSARAILRAERHIGGKHLSVRKPLGLHPPYIVLHSTGKGSNTEKEEAAGLIDESVKDIFDVVSLHTLFTTSY